MKLAIFLCEGPHDVAFIYRLLRYENYSDVSDRKIDELPQLFKEYFKQLLTDESFYEKSNLTRKPVLPQLMVKDKNNNKDKEAWLWVALYAIEGNRQSDVANKILQDYSDFLTDSMEGAHIISIAFINDADKEGVDHELNQLKKSYKSEKVILFNDINLSQNKICKILTNQDNKKFVKEGYYIFCNSQRTGKLEDIVLDIMQKDNKAVFDAVSLFLESSIAPLKKEKKYDRQKSIIGSAGQLIKSGKANTVIINDGCYMTPEKIKADPKCQEIIAFINEMTDI